MSDTQGPFRVVMGEGGDMGPDTEWLVIDTGRSVVAGYGHPVMFSGSKQEADDEAHNLNAAYSRGALKGLDDVLAFLFNTADDEAPKTPGKTLDWVIAEVKVLRESYAPPPVPGQAARGTPT